MQKHRRKEESLPILNEKIFPIIEQITTGMPGGFFIYYASGDEKLIYANQALVEMFGCESLEDFKSHTGFTFPGLVHPDDLEETQRLIHHQIFNWDSELDYVEYRIIRKDGKIRWIDDYGHYVHSDVYGDIFYVFVEDATERREKAAREARTARLAQERLEALEALERETTVLRLVHELLQSGMWTMEFDEEGRMISVFWSQEFRDMIGYTDEEDFPNKLESWSDLLHPEDRDRILEQYYAAIEDYTGRTVYDVEYRLLTKDRGYRWFRASGKLSRRDDGTPITYVGMFVDITDKVDTDQKLLEQHRLLEEALIQAEQASESKSMFLNNMSHDMRTPMNAIIGFTNLAAAHLDNQELVRDYLSKISASSSQLLSLINDVLDMSRIVSGNVVIEEKPCSLSQALRDLRDLVAADLQEKGLELTLDDSAILHPNVICDRLRLNQVLLNVLSNALKFTPSGGSIYITASETPGRTPEEAVYRIVVRDTGIGMAPAFLEHVFEAFERERTSTVSGMQGTGLGLTITKSLVELMNGDIAVESRQGEGSTFTFTIPFRHSEPPAGEEDGQDAASIQLTGQHLLLVEDNELNQEIAATILEEAGCIVDVAADGAEAVEKVKHSLEDPFDLILMDIQMPVMDGLEATRTIRALEDRRLSTLPIVSLTANALEEDRQRILSAGMNAHLGKPIDVDKLFSTLREILGGGRV